MSLEENKAVVRKFIETYNKHGLSSMDEFVAPDYVDHTNKVLNYYTVVSTQNISLEIARAGRKRFPKKLGKNDADYAFTN